MIAAASSDMFGQLQRIATATQNDKTEHLIIQELLEAVRSLDYTFLDQNKGGSFTFYPYRDGSTTSGNLFRDDPAVLDFLNKAWTEKVKSNRIGTKLIKMDIEPANGITEALQVTITVEFSDSSRIGTTSGAAGRTVIRSLVVSNTGVNRWSR